MSEKNPMEKLWDIRLEEVAGSLRKNGFEVSVFQTAGQAAEYFEKELLPAINPASVSVGGSTTARESGVYEIFGKKAGLDFINPYKPGLTPEESYECRRQGMLAELYVTSTNALLRDGRLLNLDGSGNRVGAMHFGPKKVVLFVGRNKISEDLEAARQRIKEVAAPANAIRLNRNTPCVKLGSCSECASPERICSVWTLTEKSAPKGRIHILLINQDLGY